MAKSNKKNFVLVLIIYLAGIFMGAIDTGIVTPVRTIIQGSLGVEDQVGIWMITIYTLAYATSIPITGKLADKFGRKYVYLFSITLFGLGSLFCGLSSNFGSFGVLLAARVVQAIGGGGILPVATAEFGTSFPKEKRGMALGLVGGVYGIANIFGASVGSAIVDIFGKDNWSFIFYINVPISIFILIAGFFILDNNKSQTKSKIDYLGIGVLAGMILSLLYGLKNLDFFDFKASFISTNVYPYLIVFVVLLPIFILIEKKAKDPVMNLKYFTNKNIVITLIISLISGIVMMGMIFVPQFAENAMKIPSGSGGYFVIILGVFAGIGAPLSGKLIDKFGSKKILGFGFAVSAIGSLFLAFVATKFPNIVTVVISLAFIGTGIGFTMGTPLNYMMMENTDEKESNSALATLSLIRSIGTAVAPAIMVGFIATAGANVQTNIMNAVPSEISLSSLPYVQEISDTMNEMMENEQMKEKMKDVNIPDISEMTTFDMNSIKDSDFTLSPELIKMLQNSDVTTITDNTKVMAKSMFDTMTPTVVPKIENGIQSGIDGIDTSLKSMKSAKDKMSSSTGISQIFMGSAADQIGDAIDKMEITKKQMTELKKAIPTAFDDAETTYMNQIETARPQIEKAFQDTLNGGFKNIYLTTSCASIGALIFLAFYNKKKDENNV